MSCDEFCFLGKKHRCLECAQDYLALDVYGMKAIFHGASSTYRTSTLFHLFGGELLWQFMPRNRSDKAVNIGLRTKID